MLTGNIKFGLDPVLVEVIILSVESSFLVLGCSVKS